MFHGSVPVYNVLNKCVVKPKNIVNTIKYISNIKWGCINFVLERILVKMFVASVINGFISIPWHMRFSATSDQIMEVAHSSCHIYTTSDSTSLRCEDDINERRIDRLVTSRVSIMLHKPKTSITSFKHLDSFH